MRFFNRFFNSRVWLAVAMLAFVSATSASLPGLNTQTSLQDIQGQEFTAYRWSWFGTQGWETEAGYTIVFDRLQGAWSYATLGEDGQLRPLGALVGQVPAERLGIPAHLRPRVTETAAEGAPQPPADPMQRAEQAQNEAPDCLGDEGSIGGQVADMTGSPIAGATVQAKRWAGWGYDEDAWDWAPDGWITQTDGSGNYQLPVYPGFYEVWASGNGYAGAVYSEEITVSSAAAAGPANFALAREGTVSGRVTNHSDDGLAFASVSIHRWNPLTQWWDGYGWIETDEQGDYLATGLPAGDYGFCFSAWGYVGACYNNADDLAAATKIEVAPGAAITAVNATLTQSGSLSGTLYDQDANPVDQYVRALVYDADGCCFNPWNAISACWVNLDTGAYQCGNLAPGNYLVYFDGLENYRSQWYQSAEDTTTATRVTVSGGQDTSGIDDVLAPLDPTPTPSTGTIRGTITDTQDNLITDAWVGAYAQRWIAEPGYWAWGGSGSAYDGDYVIADLSPGTYRVQFSAGDQYQEQWYDNQTDPDNATAITVTENTETTGINGRLSRWGATLSGTVTDRTTAIPVQDAQLARVLEEFGITSYTAWTDVCGRYALHYDAGRDFRVSLIQGHNSHLWPNQMFYGDTLRFDEATVVQIPSGQTSRELDISLPRSGHITGTITDANGDPVGNTDVQAWWQCGTNHYCGSWAFETVTDASGRYTLQGMLAGLYEVKTRDSNDDLWSYGKTEPNTPPDPNVSVSSGQTTTGIDIQFGGGTDPDDECYRGDGVITGRYTSGRHVIGAEGGLSTQGSVSVEFGAEVIMRAQNRIQLNHGFQVQPGGSLVADVGPLTCPWNP